VSFTRQVVAGTGIVTVAGVGGRMLTMLTVPLLSPLLGPAPYGVAALVGSVVSLAGVLALLGIDMAYTRFYLQEDERYRTSVEAFCWRFAASGAIGVALLAACAWCCWGARWLDDHRTVGAYSAAAVVLLVATTMANTRIRLLGNYRRLALTLFLGALASSLVSICLAYLWRRDAWPLLLGTAAASLTTLVLLRGPSPRVLLGPSGLPAGIGRAVIMLGLAGSVTAPMYWIISSADRWFIARYASTRELGIYSVASSVATLGLMLNSSLTLTWFPEASRVYGREGEASLALLGRLWSRLVAGLAIVWLAIVAGGGDILRLLAAPAFHSGAQYIPWLASGVFFYGLAAMANTALLLESKMRFAAYAWLAGALGCLALNFAMVPRLGALGAAMVQCATYAFIAGVILVISHRILTLPVPRLRLTLALLIAFSSGAVMRVPWAQAPIWSLAIKFVAGLAVTVIVLRVIAPDWHQRVTSGVRRLLLGREG
jgi:O-antigen/teichoic acid export membrane protein